MLVALKCDLREKHLDDDDDGEDSRLKEKEMVDYKRGLEVARRIQALRYLGTSSLLTVEMEVLNDFLRRMLGEAQSRR